MDKLCQATKDASRNRPAATTIQQQAANLAAIENGLIQGAPSPLTAGGGVDIAPGSTVAFDNVIFEGNRTVFAGGGLANAGTF